VPRLAFDPEGLDMGLGLDTKLGLSGTSVVLIFWAELVAHFATKLLD